MRIAVIDDEQYWREQIVKEIERTDFYQGGTIDVYENGDEYLKSDYDYDLSFVDIEMMGKDGFDTINEARELGKKGYFVILTTHRELAMKGYVVSAYRYIDKLSMKGGMKELFTALHNIEANNKTVEIMVTTGENVKIKVGDIVYVETNSYHVTIHTIKGVIDSRTRLADLEKMIEDDKIFRCHNSFIINLCKVKSFDKHFAYMINNERVEVSKRRYPEFRRMYMKIKFSRANF